MFVINNLNPNTILLGLSFLAITYLVVTVGGTIIAFQMLRDFRSHVPKNGGIVPIMFAIMSMLMILSWLIFACITVDFPEIYMLLHQ